MDQPRQPREVDATAEAAMTLLQRDFFVVGRTRVRTWKAWLAIGIAVGLFLGIVIVANRDGDRAGSDAHLVNLSAGPVKITRGLTIRLAYYLSQAGGSNTLKQHHV